MTREGVEGRQRRGIGGIPVFARCATCSLPRTRVEGMLEKERERQSGSERKREMARKGEMENTLSTSETRRKTDFAGRRRKMYATRRGVAIIRERRKSSRVRYADAPSVTLLSLSPLRAPRNPRLRHVHQRRFASPRLAALRSWRIHVVRTWNETRCVAPLLAIAGVLTRHSEILREIPCDR